MTKVCSRCHTEKDEEEFYFRLGVRRGQCRTCIIEISTAWKQNNRDRQRAQNLRRDFNLEWEDYQAMVEAQKGCCAICKEPTEVFHVDHNHACCPMRGKSCGKCIRGLLCHKCNTGLGMFGDSMTRLQSAKNYIRKFGGTV